MVERLRKSDSFIPQLSIVAEDKNDNVAGHILLTKINIQTQDRSHQALALAPLSIKPIIKIRVSAGNLLSKAIALPRALVLTSLLF